MEPVRQRGQPRCCWRRLFLVFLKTKTFIVHSTITFLVCIGTAIALAFDGQKSCKPDCKLWLVVCTGRILVSYCLLAFLHGVVNDIIRYQGNIHAFQKAIELMDIFGIVWFSVGNLLVFNSSTNCIHIEPAVYYFSFGYLIFVYAWFICPYAVKASLFVWPHTPDRIDTLRQARAPSSLADRPRAQLTSQQREYWFDWLMEYDCVPFLYEKEEFKRHSSEMSLLSMSDNNKNIVTASDPSETTPTISLLETHSDELSSSKDFDIVEEVDLERGIVASAKLQAPINPYDPICPVCLGDFEGEVTSHKGCDRRASLLIPASLKRVLSGFNISTQFTQPELFPTNTPSPQRHEQEQQQKQRGKSNCIDEDEPGDVDDLHPTWSWSISNDDLPGSEGEDGDEKCDDKSEILVSTENLHHQQQQQQSPPLLSVGREKSGSLCEASIVASPSSPPLSASYSYMRAVSCGSSDGRGRYSSRVFSGLDSEDLPQGGAFPDGEDHDRDPQPSPKPVALCTQVEGDRIQNALLRDVPSTYSSSDALISSKQAVAALAEDVDDDCYNRENSHGTAASLRKPEPEPEPDTEMTSNRERSLFHRNQLLPGRISIARTSTYQLAHGPPARGQAALSAGEGDRDESTGVQHAAEVPETIATRATEGEEEGGEGEELTQSGGEEEGGDGGGGGQSAVQVNISAASVEDEACKLIVHFPCRARHVFHLHCLVDWLHTCDPSAGAAGLLSTTGPTRPVTCPCCRETASKTTAMKSSIEPTRLE